MEIYSSPYDNGLTELKHRNTGCSDTVSSRRMLQIFKNEVTLQNMDSQHYKACYDMLISAASTAPELDFHPSNEYQQDILFHCMNWKVSIKTRNTQIQRIDMNIHPIFQDILNTTCHVGR